MEPEAKPPSALKDEPTPPPPPSSWKDKLKRHKCLILIMVLISIALIVGLSVGLTVGRRGKGFASAGPGPAITVARGQDSVVPSWRLESSATAGNDLAALSQAGGVSDADWHQTGLSKCTVMACLIEKGDYNVTDLFYSDNLKKVDASRFSVPWIYRQEFSISTVNGSHHYFLDTNGITSRADVWINGQELANKSLQAGAYVGHRFDITKYVTTNNALAIRVYPTTYGYDFALGFVDWNPYPADNGTGIWRDVRLKQTGPVALSSFRVAPTVSLPIGQSQVNVALKATIQNLEDSEVTVDIAGELKTTSGPVKTYQGQQTVTLGPMQSQDVELAIQIADPQIWWPARWGSQPLYTARVSATSNDTLSDASSKTFGIRTVTKQLNTGNDTIFFVNGQPFQVVGGGYSADMFLRWDPVKFEMQARYMLDLGHNTVRLEGKQEHPDLYEIADRLGLMVMAGWECCDKWEAWPYNQDLLFKPFPTWTDADYDIAGQSMRHEGLMMQSHPSLLAFLVGSDYWPDDRATQLYVDAMKAVDWQTPIIASASKRGYPDLLGPSGMKMEGPYDWVPPNYWYDVVGTGNSSVFADRTGAAFGFGSELGAGVGTPELSSLRRFQSDSDLQDLWKSPDKGLYHMSNEGSQFFDRRIYNDALNLRLGNSTSLDDYVLKAQLVDYEATRAQFEAFAIRWSATDRPATGLIYWMLNNAWPSLHWNLFDYYLHPGGSYFGAKTATAGVEHVAYDYVRNSVHIINRSLNRGGNRMIDVEVIDLQGRPVWNTTATSVTVPNSSKMVVDKVTLGSNGSVVLLRLVMRDEQGNILSRNVYWLANQTDALDWSSSTWYHTPVTRYADYTSLTSMPAASNFTVTASTDNEAASLTNGSAHWDVELANKGSGPVFFVRLDTVRDSDGGQATPIFYTENYITLWPNDTMQVHIEIPANASAAGERLSVEVSGMNVSPFKVSLP